MNTFKNICIIAVLALVFTSCKSEANPEIKTVNVEVNKKDVSQSLDPNATYAKVEFGIDGMTCAMGCAKTIEKKMAKMDGVKSAKVDFDKRLAMVEYDEAKVTPKTLEEAVTNVADIYKVKDMKVVDNFEGDKKETCKKTKVECEKMSEAEKKACSKECKKDCCSEEKKAE